MVKNLTSKFKKVVEKGAKMSDFGWETIAGVRSHDVLMDFTWS